MLPEETFPLHNAAARSSFWAVGPTGPRCRATELAQGSWLGPGTRRPTRALSRFPAKENPWGMGFWRRSPGPQSSMAQGARGSPARLCPRESGGPGAKMACVAFLSRGALGLLLAAQGEFSIAEYRCQKLVLRRKCDGVSALSGRAGSGGMAAAWAQKDFAHQILLPGQGEPIGSWFRALETPSKATGPREPGAAPPRFALWRAEGRGRKYLALLS